MLQFILAVFSLFEDTLEAAWELEAFRFFGVLLLFLVVISLMAWLIHLGRAGKL